MSSRPVCSVLIANYNGTAMVGACIESVLVQDCGFEIEIIVHDDASTDGSADFVRSRYPQVTLIESPGNVGFCISNNRMAAQANGEFILLLNNDAELLPDALRTLFAYASKSRTPAILSLPQYAADTGELIDIGNELDLFLNPIPNRKTSIVTSGTVIGACLWLPKSLWNELGGFPDWFGSIAEDMYLCCVARLWGYQVLALPRSGFRHRLGSSLGGARIVNAKLSTTLSRRALSERNKSFVMILSYPWPALIVILPLHLLLLLLEGIFLSIVKLNFDLLRQIYLPCPIALWKERKRLSALRLIIQTKKKISMGAFFSVFRWLPHKLEMLWRYGIPKIK